MLLEFVCLEDKIGHLFVVEKATPKQLMYNKLYCPIFEKTKILDASERSVFTLSETMREGNKSYLCTKKTHATMLKKQFIPLYLEHLLFLIRRVGWKETKIYYHYIFNQERFKKDFILLN